MLGVVECIAIAVAVSVTLEFSSIFLSHKIMENRLKNERCKKNKNKVYKKTSH